MEGYLKHRVTIAGDVMLMHNGQTADPSNPYSRAMKEITSDRTRKNTDEGIAALSRIEYEAGLYLDAKKRVILPSRILEAHICEAARKSKEGKSALAGMFVDTDALLEYAGGPMTVEELAESPEQRFVTGVAVGQGKVMRTRPIFRDWRATFEVSLLAEQAGTRQLETWLRNGGALVGIGDFRPRYGRYQVVSVEPIEEKKQSKKAA
jgi:hypothetical protein